MNSKELTHGNLGENENNNKPLLITEGSWFKKLQENQNKELVSTFALWEHRKSTIFIDNKEVQFEDLDTTDQFLMNSSLRFQLLWKNSTPEEQSHYMDTIKFNENSITIRWKRDTYTLNNDIVDVVADDDKDLKAWNVQIREWVPYFNNEARKTYIKKIPSRTQYEDILSVMPAWDMQAGKQWRKAWYQLGSVLWLDYSGIMDGKDLKDLKIRGGVWTGSEEPYSFEIRNEDTSSNIEAAGKLNYQPNPDIFMPIITFSEENKKEAQQTVVADESITNIEPEDKSDVRGKNIFNHTPTIESVRNNPNNEIH